MADTAKPTAGPRPTCPICGRASEPAARPFCSVRCADADLGHWLTGRYRVAGPPAGAEQDSDESAAGGRLDPDDGLS